VGERGELVLVVRDYPSINGETGRVS